MKKYFNIYSLAIIVGTMFLTIVACADKDGQEIVQSSNGNISIRSVKFVDDDNVLDIDDEVKNNGSVKKQVNAGSLKASATFGSEKIAPLAIQGGAEFDYIADVSSNAVGLQGLGAKASAKGASLKAADVPLATNKKFRLIFIKDGSTTPLYNEVLNAGQDPNLRVDANTKYQWYAFSINDVNTVPNIDNSGSIDAAALANRDFMFASGEIITKAEDNYLDILFLRQTAAVEVKIDTRGLFGRIDDNSTFSVGTGTGTSFTNIIQTGNFSIFTAVFSNLEDVAPINGAQMTVVDTRWGNAEKIAHFYTANTSRTIAANNLRVRLNELDLVLDDNSARVFSPNSSVPITHSAALSLTKGTLSRTNVRLIESGLNINGLIWARTNMIYDVNKLYGGSYIEGSSDAYRFRVNNNYSSPNANTEYWNFGTTTPNGTDYISIDQCTRVYPEGTWRLPNELENSEMTNLSQNTSRQTSRTTFNDGVRHSFTWRSTQPVNSAFPDNNNLILSYYGYRDANGNIQERPSGSNTAAGSLRYLSNSYDSGNQASYNLYAQTNSGNYGSPSVQRIRYNIGGMIRCVRRTVNN